MNTQSHKAALEAAFLDAVPKLELSKVARDALGRKDLDDEARDFANLALETCQNISAQNEAEHRAIVQALSDAGVRVDAGSDRLAPTDAQFHRVVIRIAGEDLARAVETLTGLGYVAPLGPTPGRLAALRQFATSLQFVRFDEATTRLVLEFGDRSTARRLPRLFQPGTADVAQFDAPAMLWWSYALAKPFRLFRERALGGTSSRHEIDYLGTPKGLIAPILESLPVVSGETLLDLGCGEGRVLLEAAETFGAKAIGIEHDLDLVLRARENAATSTAAERIEVRHESAQTADLSEADVVFVFMPKWIVEALMPSVIDRMKSGARLVVHEQSNVSGHVKWSRIYPVIGPSGITIVRVFSKP